MADDFAGGIGMAIRRWPRLLGLSAMISVACAVMAILLADVLIQFSALRAGSELRARGAVVFTPFYTSDDVTAPAPATVESLSEMIESEDAYTAIVHNVQVNDPGFLDGVPVIVTFGSMISKLLPDVDQCAPAPCASAGRGVDLSSIPNEFEFAGSQIEMRDRLAPGASFFDANLGSVPLDDSIVLNLPPDSIGHLDPYELEEALIRAVILTSDASSADSFVASAARNGLQLVPHNVAIDQPQRLAAMMVMSGMYVLGLVAFLGIVVAAFISSAFLTVRDELATFIIRRTYGASVWNSASRIGGFVFAAVVVPATVPLLALSLLGPPISSGAAWMVLAVSMLGAGLWALVWRMQARMELERR
ncbi:hypothetical protein [Cellulosimicrobium marinum]|uniref:hypothetical protein n=1 Tax=Cellulosimicrobium marinum TaxID=1638992 RepID=UPI001E52BCE2|nr:hypothetical protein [Cellulosimicrobium marinum]MCB7138256.1 hypothetical protein [Cellulosimicrobium marinum]